MPALKPHADGRRISWALLAIILLSAIQAFWLEPASLRRAEYRIASPAPDLTGLRIAVIADLHGGAAYIGEDKIDRVVVLANESNPDLILLTGDYIVQGVLGGRPMPIETIAGHLRGLRARLGVYAVLGNHDRVFGDGPRVTAALTAAGIRVLADEAVTISRGQRTLHLVGISDFASGQPNLSQALGSVPEGSHALCFTHSPDVFPELPATCALTIAGHTHGGQVWFPIVGRMIVPSSYGQRYAIGLVSENGKLLFVSSGIGTSIISVRFFVPPEVSVLDIR